MKYHWIDLLEEVSCLMSFFVQRQIKMLGMDLPSPDNYPFEIHKKLFDSNILIIENLTNLSALADVKNFNVIAFPLKIKAEASIVRVVAEYKILNGKKTKQMQGKR